MPIFFSGLLLFLVVLLFAGAVRILRGPRRSDRVLAIQFFGTIAVAILLVLAEDRSVPALRDVALVVAILVTINVVTFTRRRENRE